MTKILCGGALAVALAMTGACSSNKASIDAPPVPAPFTSVSCPTTPDAVVTATMSTPFAYTPVGSTISVGQTVQFKMPGLHDVEGTSANDPLLTVAFGGTSCFKFTTAGTYTFRCGAHLFVGSVTVQ